MGRACVVIAAFNEESRIGTTVEAAGRLPEVEDVWVVDDGSRDDTAHEARRRGARTISLPRNAGKGRALMEGLRRVRADAVVLIDADLEDSAVGVAPLLASVLGGEADVAIGHVDRASSSRGFGLVKAFAARGLYVRCGRRFMSPLSGQRVLAWHALPHVLPLAPGWGVEVGMTLDAVRAGLRVAEIPVSIRHRVTGRDWRGLHHRAGQLRDIAAALAGRRLPAPSPAVTDEPLPGEG